MRVLALSFVAAGALGLIACDQEQQADASNLGAAVSTDAAVPADGSTRRPGDLTAFYKLHVAVVSDTCSPNRVIAPDTEVLVWGDRARDLFNIPLPDIAASVPDHMLHLPLLEVPLEHHITPDLLVASCPDVRMDIETGPFDISGRHIVVPYTTTWRHADTCSDAGVHSFRGPPTPSEDCVLKLTLTLDWSRACPPPSHTFPRDGGVAVYCE